MAATLLMCGNTVAAELSAADKSIGITKRKAFGDWEMLCDKQRCSLIQAVREKNSKQLFMTAEIAADPGGKRGLVFSIAPIGIDFLKGVEFIAADGASRPLPLRTCYVAGCIATLPMDDLGGLESFSTSGKTVYVSFSTIENPDVMRIPVTLNGLESAVKELTAGTS